MTIEDVPFDPRRYLPRDAAAAVPQDRAIPAVPTALDRPFAASLHGVRGLAALAVVWSHVLALFVMSGETLGPLHLVAGGGAAVALFYVLSGAVLAISLKRFTASPSAYVAYGLRRLFRLYPLLIATTAFAFFYAFAIHPHVARALFSPGFFGHYDEEVGPIKIAASFLGLIDKANPPTWSIFVELVASALLPAFVLFARDLRRAALLAGGLLVVSFAAYELPDNHVLLYRWPVFMVNFAVGILALYAAERLRAPLSRLPDLARLGATIALFLVLMNGRDLMDAAGYAYRGHADPVTNLFEMAVSFALIVLLLEAAPRVMASRPLKWLGDLSYGVYLIHFPMLFTLAGLSVILIGEDVLVAHAGGFMIAVAILAPAVTLAASALTWRYLEAPMISLGRRLSDAVSPPRRG